MLRAWSSLSLLLLVACGAEEAFDSRSATAPDADPLPRWIPASALEVTHSRAVALRGGVPEQQVVELSLPNRGDGWVQLRDPLSALSASFRLVGAASTERIEHRNLFVHPELLGPGTFGVQRPLVHGVEDFVGFRAPPRDPRVSYELETSGSGLRLVDDVLELLDAEGSPRLRMAQPKIVDRAGVSHRARVAVVGCDVDTSTAPPWGRRPIPPGQSRCLVTIDFDNAAIEYPAVLDPAWTLTDVMVHRRYLHTATLLPNGFVLLAGGRESTNTGDIDSAEIYDPTSNQFSPTGSMAEARSYHSAVRVGADVLVVGRTNAERFNGATWSLAGTLTTPRAGPYRPGVGTINGTAIVCGGKSLSGVALKSCELFDAANSTWNPTGAMQTARDDLEIVETSTKVFAVGGSTDTLAAALEIESSPKGPAPVWSWSQNFPNGHWGGAAIPLADGTLLMVGGVSGLLNGTGVAHHVFNQPPWMETSVLGSTNALPLGTQLPNGRVLIAGGSPHGAFSSLVQAAIFDLSTKSWTTVGSLKFSRYYHTLTLLTDGSALVTGGETGKSLVHDDGEVFRLKPDGDSCLYAIECDSDHCVDGVCCESACTGKCEGCAAEKTAGADGACAPIDQGKDPDGDCDPTTACGLNGQCDGAGGCEIQEATTVCTPATCSGSTAQWAECDGAGSCATKQKVCTPFPCVDGVCQETCSATDPCEATGYCSSGICEPKLANGKACSSTEVCLTGYCVDGFCCDTPCTGQCESCEAGSCEPVTGQPVGGRPACPAATSVDQPCTAKSCNGIASGSCEAFASNDTICTVGECAGAVLTLESHCDGNGACDPPGTAPCQPYVCGTEACLTTCESSADCIEGATCTPTGECVTGSHCKDDHTLVPPTGDPIDCGRYRCQADRCLDACNSVEECTPPNVCDFSGQCVPAPSDEEDEGGCGCRSAPREPRALWPIGVLFFLAFGRRGSRRTVSRVGDD